MVDDGIYPAGARLPSQPDLARAFGVSEPVINQAVKLLASRGVLDVRRGYGTFVRKIPLLHHDLTRRYLRQSREAGGARGPFQADAERAGLTARSDTEITREIPPARVARQLGLGDGTEALVRRRRQYAGDVPVQFAPSWYPLDIAAATVLEEHDTGPGGTMSRLADLGHPLVRVTARIRVRQPADEELAFLGTGADEPVIEIFRTAWTAERPVEVTVIAMPAYGWEIDADIPVD